MYLLDTNVISELRKAKVVGKCDQNVLKWAKTVPSSSLFLSAISILELEMGVLLLERRDSTQGKVLRTWLDSQVIPAFQDRIVPIDLSVAQCCAQFHVPNPRSDRDALIGASALVHGMMVVTRNVNDFKSMGVKLLNPWEVEK
jgi:predicted nucleic acid-binding protein